MTKEKDPSVTLILMWFTLWCKIYHTLETRRSIWLLFVDSLYRFFWWNSFFIFEIILSIFFLQKNLKLNVFFRIRKECCENKKLYCLYKACFGAKFLRNLSFEVGIMRVRERLLVFSFALVASVLALARRVGVGTLREGEKR